MRVGGSWLSRIWAISFWLRLLSLVLATAGYFGPWVPHETAALTVTGFELAEFAKFFPQVQGGVVPVIRALFLTPLVAAAILFASLAPVGWQMRFGLHWLVEHFLVFFALTTFACLAWPKPMIVAGVLVPFAVLLEAAQALTPDRTPDLATALSAAAGVSLAALLFDLGLTLHKKWRKA